jgi:hypothetical protein
LPQREANVRSDKKANLEALQALVAKIIEEQPVERDGFVWAALPQAEWAKRLGLADRTVRRLVKEPPLTHMVVQDGKGVKTTLIREGQPATKTAKHLANIMSQIFKEKTGGVVSRNAYGCLIKGLAVDWPDGLQVEIFKSVLDDWPAFMVGVDQAIVELGGTKRYYKHPTIRLIRRFHAVALDHYLMQVQASGKAPPPALVKHLGYWPQSGLKPPKAA